MDRNRRTQIAHRLDAIADKLSKAEDEARKSCSAFIKTLDQNQEMRQSEYSALVESYVVRMLRADIDHAVRVIRTEASQVRPKRRKRANAD